MTTLPDPRILRQLRQYFVAGYFEEPDASPLRRWARAVRRRFENRTIRAYDGGPLFFWRRAVADDPTDSLIAPSYSFTWELRRAALDQARAQAEGPERTTLAALDEIMTAEDQRRSTLTTVHRCGGGNYTHSIPNYGRVLREGLDRHGRRLRQGLRAAADQDRSAERGDFYEALLDVLAGVRRFHKRLIQHLEAYQSPHPTHIANRDRLLAAYRRIPFRPARDFFEALAAYEYTWMLDDCDNPGRIDFELNPFYVRDRDAGGVTHQQAVELLRCLHSHVSEVYGWSSAIGGRDAQGRADFTEMTQICLEAAHGFIRPSYELRVTADMPDHIWQAAFDALDAGGGQPAFYNEDLYRQALRDLHLGVSEADLALWNGGGCTETMVHGCSNVGSIEAGVHLLLLLEESLREDLLACSTFADFMAAYRRRIAATVNEVCRQVCRQQQAAAEHRPQPMRSLLIDDCIDCGLEYNAGGARYNWSVVSMAGLANVADSLAALREVVYERRELTAAQLLDVLARDFADAEPLRQRLMRCPRYGNDDPLVDELAADVLGCLCDEFALYAPWRGGKYVPSCIMFETYAHYGHMVGATPDGRRAQQPLADSVGPVQGRDVHGPTAMVNSVTRLTLHRAPGTPVLNCRFTRETFARRENRPQIRRLIETYFRLGGMQMQISVLDSATLRHALEHPGEHGDLIVRIGGYSTYFNNLSPELKRAVIERTEHAV